MSLLPVPIFTESLGRKAELNHHSNECQGVGGGGKKSIKIKSDGKELQFRKRLIWKQQEVKFLHLLKPAKMAKQERQTETGVRNRATELVSKQFAGV